MSTQSKVFDQEKAFDEATKMLESFKLGDLLAKDFAPRPGFGTQGKAIQVSANMFATSFTGKKGMSINFYDVEINPVVKVANQKKPKQLPRKVWNQATREQGPGPAKSAFDASAYDGNKLAYSANAFPLAGGKFETVIGLIEDGRDPKSDSRRFRVVLTFTAKVDLDVLTDFCSKKKQSQEEMENVYKAIQACNILFREDPTSRFTPVGAQGRRFFGVEDSIPMSGGGVVCQGFIQSFRHTQTGVPAMQLDTAYSAFIQPGPFLEVAARLLGLSGGGGGGARGGRGGFDRGRGRGGAPQGGRPADISTLDKMQIRRLMDYLRMAKFTVTHRKTDRVFTIGGISSQPAEELKFLVNGRDGAPDKMMSIPEYYKVTYNVTVTRPRLPCVFYGKKNYIPLEFVRIADFNSIPMTRLSSDQTADMIRVAAKPPPERAAKIREWRAKLNYSNLPKVRAWGLNVAPDMMKVKARFLNPPGIMYGGGKPMRANNGGWNLKGVKFTKPGRLPLNNWAVVSFDQRCGPPDMQKFVTFLVGVLKANACPVQNAQPQCFQHNPHAGGHLQGIKSGLQLAAQKAFAVSSQTPQLIVGKDTAMYMEIKKQAAMGLKMAVPTQCLQSAKIKSDRGMDQYCGNVSMKIHSKLGGVTHQVPMPQVLDKNTMMVGADVTHPPPQHGLVQPSIAVTVSAINGDNVQFGTNIRLQEGRTEIIKDFATMIGEHITTFERNTKAKPTKIVVFRDGVSEGQWSHVVENEVKAIRDAAHKLGAAYRPKITFVVCAKRHNMRFFADNDSDRDRTGNLQPGTVVDEGVTHPFAFDFYLQAHSGLQGTARPTHYIVVKDENAFTADKMQNLCNALSYSYARATRSVSMVPVAYYADIIATQARSMVYTEGEDDSATVSSGGPPKHAEFRPTLISDRFKLSKDFDSVAWYM